MFKDYAGSLVVLLLACGLFTLNVVVTSGEIEPWEEDAKARLGSRQMSKVIGKSILIAFVVFLVTVAFVALGVTSRPMGVLAAVCIVLPTMLRSQWGPALASVVSLLIAFVVLFPGMLAAQVIWLLPLVPLAGFLPRLMVALGSKKTLRPAYWLMDIRIWAGLVVMAVVGDALLKLDAFRAFGWVVYLQFMPLPEFVWINFGTQPARSDIGWLAAG